MQLVFSGEVLSGFRLDDVKRSLGELLKLDEARMARLFSGAPTVLKRALLPDEARRYVDRLARVGALIRIEPCEQSLAAAPAAAAPAPAVDEIECPKCGERQPRQVFCRACTTNMPMGIAAKLEAEQEARAARLAESRARRGLPAPGEAAADDEAPPMWGLGFSGRMARLPYATAGGWMVTALYLLTLMMIHGRWAVPRVILAGVGFILVLVVALRASVLRCHDFDRSGWWSLTTLVPYVGAIAALVISLMPGTRGDNDHGGPARRGSWLGFGLSMLAMCLAIGLTIQKAMSMMSLAGAAPPHEARAVPDEQLAGVLRSAEAVRAYREEYAGAAGHKAFAVSEGGAWGFKTGAGSVQDALEGAIANCDAHRKPYTAECAPVNLNGSWAPDQ
ncbi:MAG TPA: DUF805 domain-containing protein [Albitalea sp.]|uniref:DUF805 domain-containing protein n=1 Tax=Piscinibacter sp. TaxID=1903157 RepID=UPI002ED5AAF6